MEDNIRLYLVRHGETQWNQQRRMQGGNSDTPLADTGINQAKSLGMLFKDRTIEAIYSSPLKRALVTAQTIASYHDISVSVQPGFKEIEVGELEGTQLDKLPTDFSNYLLDWQQDKSWDKLPGGESLSDLQGRILPVLQDIIKQHSGTVIIVSHYFVTLIIICTALGMPLRDIRRFRIQAASVSALDYENNKLPSLALLGDTCHLKEN